MPGETTITLTLAPNSGQAKPFPFVLKKVMDIPPPNILDESEDDIKKEKLCLVESDQSGGNATGGGEANATLGGTAAAGTVGDGRGNVSASLTPAIWEKTIPYDGENFHLEYMDLDEFLLENGIPISLDEELQRDADKSDHSSAASERPGEEVKTSLVTSTCPQNGDTEEESCPKSSGPHSTTVKEREKKKGKVVPQQFEEDEEDEEDDDGEDVETVADTVELKAVESDTECKSGHDRVTPTPIDPEDIEVDVNFQPDPTDLVLSSVPGGELFNPRKHRFAEDELKPQPMIKKARKVFVPDDAKDDKYWSRRKKNNVAAKRSRDARRLKENQIAVRASFLERENAALKQEVAKLREDCGRCKNIIARYEVKYGPL